MFVLGCQDSVHHVAASALSSISSYVVQLGNCEEINRLHPVINPMLSVMAKCLQNGDEDLVIEALEVIQECCSLDQPLINDYIEAIVTFVMNVLHEKDNDSSVQQSAAQTLMDIIEYRPKLFAKKNLISPVLSTLMDMIAKDETSAAGSLFTVPNSDAVLDEKEDDDDDFSHIDVPKLAQTIIDTMAIHIPSKYFSDPVLAMVSQGMSSPDPQMRKAGCAVLGVITEGCCDRIRDNLSSIVPSILVAVQDTQPYVRECACFALGQFSEFCQPEILDYYETVLPVIFQALDDPRPTMQATTCYVLEYFCENLQPDILRPYLSTLMNKLAVLLQTGDKGTQEMALTAIAATAVAAEKDFLPYTGAICEVLRQLLFQTEPSMFTIRGRALDCLGHIAVALEDDLFTPYFEMGMQSTLSGIELNNELLKEHSFIFIANIAKVRGKKFEPFLGKLVPYILEVAQESEIFRVENEDEEDDNQDQDYEEDEEDDDDDGYRLNIMEGFINTKKAALTALGALAEHTQELFIPFLKQTLETVVTKDIGSIHSLHESIRGESVNILQFLVIAASCYAKMPSPKQGEILPLDSIVAEVTKASLEVCIMTFISDDEKLPVSNACQTVEGILENVGLSALQLPVENNEPALNGIMSSLLSLLSEKAPCQVAAKADHQDEGDDNDHDQVVIDAVADLVSALAKYMGPSFVPYFTEFHKLLLKFTKPARTHSDRAMAIGCYAEVFAYIGQPCLNFAEQLFPILQAGLADPAEGVRRNSAYCLAVLVEKAGTALVPHYMNFLQWLHPVCVHNIESKKSSGSGGPDVDNAIAAVSKMINFSPNTIPLNHVIPVILDALPMHGDNNEGPIVYGCLSNLVQVNESNTVSLISRVIGAFAEALSPRSKATDETKVICIEALRNISKSPYSNALSAYFSSVNDPEFSRYLASILN